MSGTGWSDLAFTYYIRSLLKYEKNNEQFSAMALRCQKIALLREEQNAQFWNNIGVYSFNVNPKMSQHSFIKAIQFNSKNAVAWSNLGYLYFIHNEMEMATQAFQNAQILDPDCPNPWAGQAFLQQSQNGQNSQESLSLLHHSVYLSSGTLVFNLI